MRTTKDPLVNASTASPIVATSSLSSFPSLAAWPTDHKVLSVNWKVAAAGLPLGEHYPSYCRYHSVNCKEMTHRSKQQCSCELETDWTSTTQRPPQKHQHHQTLKSLKKNLTVKVNYGIKSWCSCDLQSEIEHLLQHSVIGATATISWHTHSVSSVWPIGNEEGRWNERKVSHRHRNTFLSPKMSPKKPTIDIDQGTFTGLEREKCNNADEHTDRDSSKAVSVSVDRSLCERKPKAMVQSMDHRLASSSSLYK